MIRWHVTVSADIPYPWDQTFVLERSNPGAAVSEAIKLYRKAVRQSKGKAKKIDDFRLRIHRGSQIESDSADDET